MLLNKVEYESREWQVARIIKLVSGLDMMAVVRVVHDLMDEYECMEDVPDKIVYERYCEESERG